MAAALNLLKLSVGTETVSGLMDWQKTVIARNRGLGLDPYPTHTTRMWPKREEELLKGGSIYWVIKGVVLCRQTILRLDERRGEDGIRRCAIVLDPNLIRTLPQPRRAFQGWRYLKGEDAPGDLARALEGEVDLPVDLQSAMAEYGVV